MRLLLLAPVLALAACQSLPEEAPAGPLTEYLCPDGNRVSTAPSADGQTLRLRLRGETHTLSRRGDAEAARWSDGRHTLEPREEGVRLTVAGQLLALNCRQIGEARPAPALPTAVLPGTINYRQRVALSPEAVVTVRLLDASRADAAADSVAEQVLRAPGQVPIAFALPYDERRIRPQGRYLVEVRIEENGQLRFRNLRPFGVLTQGQPLRADVWLDMVSSP
ncbi:MAG: YbaY family lipoprotein [Moraxellaceae bacterium]